MWLISFAKKALKAAERQQLYDECNPDKSFIGSLSTTSKPDLLDVVTKLLDKGSKSNLIHQENPSVLAQGCAKLSVLADLAGYIFLAGLGPARTIFCKYGKCNHQVRQVQYETRVREVQQ